MIQLKKYWFKDPVSALVAIKEQAYDHDRFTLEEYMDVLAQNLWRFERQGMDIQGETLEEKAASCLQQLIDKGMIHLH